MRSSPAAFNYNSSVCCRPRLPTSYPTLCPPAANDPDSINNLVDRHTLVPSQYACLPAASEPHDRPSAAASSEPLPAMEDLPATLVSRVLYGGVPLPQACEAEQRDPLFDAIPRREASARGLASST